MNRHSRGIPGAEMSQANLPWKGPVHSTSSGTGLIYCPYTAIRVLFPSVKSFTICSQRLSTCLSISSGPVKTGAGRLFVGAGPDVTTGLAVTGSLRGGACCTTHALIGTRQKTAKSEIDLRRICHLLSGIWNYLSMVKNISIVIACISIEIFSFLVPLNDETGENSSY